MALKKMGNWGYSIPPETDSWHLKMDDWNTTEPPLWGLFSELLLVLGRLYHPVIFEAKRGINVFL